MFVPTSRWQRAVISVALAVPLLTVVILSAPAWVALPFLPKDRQRAVMQLLDRIVEWIKVLSRIR